MTHYRLPLTVAPAGGLVELADGAPREIAQSAQVVLSTRVGERADEPTFGSFDPLFTALGGLVVDVEALATWEPRATADVVKIRSTSTGGGATA